MLSLSAAQESRKDSTSPWKASTAELPSQGKHPAAAARGWPAKISRAESSDRSLASTGSVLPLKQTRLCFFPGKEKTVPFGPDPGFLKTSDTWNIRALLTGVVFMSFSPNSLVLPTSRAQYSTAPSFLKEEASSQTPG